MVLRISLFFSLLLIGCNSPISQKGFEESEFKLNASDLFEIHCSNCHGMKGNLGNSGAKDLSKSQFTIAQIKEIVSEGKKAMPPLGELIANPSEMDSIVNYVLSLRK
ncbi:MAG: cytochrome c5 [Psychromonas sp.]|jgi:cytochrome c5